MMERILAILLVLLLAACATPSTRLPVTTNTDVNAAKRTVATTNLPTPRYVNDYDAMSHIGRVTARLSPAANSICRHLAEDECQWDVQYSSDPEFNAYASGESDIVINNGIISVARNDDELALVIAHEMSHHIADHLSEMQQNAAVGALFMGLLGAYSAQSNYYSPQVRQQMIQDSMNLGATIGARSYSKQQEREADYLAAYIVKLGGYDLELAGGLLVTLAKADDLGVNRFQGFLGTHPTGPERIAAWRATRYEIEITSSPRPILK